MKETIQTAAESFLPALWAMSRAMYDHPEPVSYTHLFDGLCAALLCPERLGECSQRFHGNASQFHMVLPPIESNIFYFTQLRGTI